VKKVMSAIENGEFVESNGSMFLSYKSAAITELSTAFIDFRVDELDTTDRDKMDKVAEKSEKLFTDLMHIARKCQCKIVYRKTTEHGWKAYVIRQKSKA